MEDSKEGGRGSGGRWLEGKEGAAAWKRAMVDSSAARPATERKMGRPWHGSWLWAGSIDGVLGVGEGRRAWRRGGRPAAVMEVREGRRRWRLLGTLGGWASGRQQGDGVMDHGELRELGWRTGWACWQLGHRCDGSHGWLGGRRRRGRRWKRGRWPATKRKRRHGGLAAMADEEAAATGTAQDIGWRFGREGRPAARRRHGEEWHGRAGGSKKVAWRGGRPMAWWQAAGLADPVASGGQQRGEERRQLWQTAGGFFERRSAGEGDGCDDGQVVAVSSAGTERREKWRLWAGGWEGRRGAATVGGVRSDDGGFSERRSGW